MTDKLCPVCVGEALRPRMTRQGVEVDVCERCRGVWLDRGEIYHFTRRPRTLHQLLEAGVREAVATTRRSPATGQPLCEVPLLGGRLKVDLCPQSGGLWLDAGELVTLVKEGHAGVALEIPEAEALPESASLPGPIIGAATTAVTAEAAPAAARPVSSTFSSAMPAAASAAPIALLGLPSLALRSLTVLVGLYAVLGVLLVAVVEAGLLGATAALVIAVAIAVGQFVLSPWLMDFSLRWFYQLRWATPGELPEAVDAFLRSVCDRERMKYPHVGIIEDGAPNAFTYGHTPNNARVVVTRGLFELLDTHELNAVIAHELGHARHWDILLMTVANLVPFILYYVYRSLSRIRLKKEAESVRFTLTVVAYVLYIVSEYVVLWLSRIREYYADRFSGEVTGDPARLASALVKIGYGLAGRGYTAEEEQAAKPAQQAAPRRRRALEAVGALGIFDAGSARALALTSTRPATGAAGGDVDRDLVRKAARWDLWNPWATYYELHSTHPLIAKRLRYLGNQSQALGQAPYVVFDEIQPENFWDEFLVDLATLALPLLALVIGVGLFIAQPGFPAAGLGVLGLGIALGVKTLRMYPTRLFPAFTVSGLLASVKVSAVRPVPCTLRGTIIGRGVPGLIWSEDFVMQEDTGIMFLDYRQPLAIWQWLFGLLKAGTYQGREVTVTGWYRRSPTPFVEIYRLEADGSRRTCYAYVARLAVAVLLLITGAVLILWPWLGF